MDASIFVYLGLTVAVLALALFIDNRYTAALAHSATALPPSSRQLARNRIAAFGIFFLLTAVSALRFALGNDYWEYRLNFQMIYDQRHVASEAAYNVLIRYLVGFLGYNNYLPIFALFSLITVTFLMLALRDQGQYYFFSLFLLMTGGYYFNSLNTIRYYIALFIALYSMKHVIKGDYLRFLFWIMVGFIFHKTILLVIPVYLVARWLAKDRIPKWVLIPGLLLFASLIFCQDFYRMLIFKIYPYYENSSFDQGQVSYANIAKCVAVLLLCIICYNNSLRQDVASRFYALLNFFGLVAFCCGSFVPESTRLGFYMTISQVFLIPRLIAQIPQKWLRNVCYFGVYFAFTVFFALLLRNMYDGDIRLLPYRSWLFSK